MQHILHIITTINRGGAENHLQALVTAQLRQGLQVTVAYLKGDGYWTEDLQGKGARVVPLQLIRYGDPLPALRLQSLIRSVRPDLIHAHLQPAELYARLALLLTGLIQPPLVISKHNDEAFYKGHMARPLGRWVAKRAAHIIAISAAVKDFFLRDLGLAPHLITTIHYGIDPIPYQTVSRDQVLDERRQWGIPDNAWVIGTVARLVPQKALHVMITAYAAYCRNARQDSRLVLVGRGPLEEELRQIAEHEGIGSKIIWAGFREDIPVVMNSFDLFALSSIYEGFGLVLLEAMAAARALVGTAVSAIPEVVCDGETGILCPKNDVGAMAQAFTRLEEAATRQAFGAAGRARTLTSFTIDKMLENTLAIYAAALRQGKGLQSTPQRHVP